MELCIWGSGCLERGDPDGNPEMMILKLRTEPPDSWGPDLRALARACWVAFTSLFPMRGLSHLIAVMVKAAEGWVGCTQ